MESGIACQPLSYTSALDVAVSLTMQASSHRSLTDTFAFLHRNSESSAERQPPKRQRAVRGAHGKQEGRLPQKEGSVQVYPPPFHPLTL